VVGEGAYGVVMRCRSRESGDTVAIKEFKINADDPDAEEVRRTSKREVMVLKALKHPNIVKYLGEFYIADKLYVMMEFVPRNLLEILEDAGHGLDRKHVKHCIFQLCKAVCFIHGCGYVYRDIKPENLLIDSKGALKLCDFGFARRIDEKTGHNGDILTDYVATRWYRAPELLLGPPFAGPDGNTIRTGYGKGVDMWAIGCLMGELTDGEPLFAGDSDIDQLHRIQRCVGALTPGQMMAFSINPNNAGIQFDLPQPEGLPRRYAGKMNEVELDFLGGLLKINPTERSTGEACCRHRYFADYPEAQAYVKQLDAGRL